MKRLMGVLAAARALLLVVAAVVVTAPSALAAEPVTGQGSDVVMAIEPGLAGYVDPTAPVPVTVELTAGTLTVGRLELDMGGSTVSTAVEVPAGGAKRYALEGAAPMTRRQLTVRLIDDQGNEVASESVRLQVAGDQVLVGVLDIEGIDTALRSAASTPLQREIVVLPVAVDDIGPRLGPLDYLVAGPGTLTDLDDDRRLGLTEWVTGGGRLYGPAAEVTVVADPGPGRVMTGTELTVARLGSGEVGVLETAASLSPADWGRIIRDRPGSSGIVDQSRQNAALALISAASAGQEASVPALPWLLAGIVVFILLVGPVNFLVLRSLGRPEWAWATVPLLSVVFLGAFWGIGRSQLVDFSASHGAVIYDGGGGTEGSAGFLLQVGAEGEHLLAVPEGWEPVPPAGNLGGGSTSGVITEEGVRFDLAALGLGATETRWSGDALALTASASLGEEGLSVTVENGTEWTLWAWGVVVNGIGFNGREPLAPGASGVVEVGSNFGRSAYDPVIVEAVGRRPFDPDSPQRSYDVVYPLASHLEYQVPEIRDNGAYLFGVTSEATFPMTVDGRKADSTGTTLLVQRIEIDEVALAELGGIRPEVLAVEGASSIERHGDDIYAYGADAFHFHYAVPAGATGQAEIGGSFGAFDRVEVYDWSAGEYRPFTTGTPFDVAALSSAGGDLVLRASNSDKERFFDQAITLARYALRWSDA